MKLYTPAADSDTVHILLFPVLLGLFAVYLLLMEIIEDRRQYWDSSPLPLISWGEEACQPGHEYGGMRSYLLIHFILEGRGRFSSEGRSWKLEQGDSFIIFPGTHNLYRAAAEAPWHYFWLGFDPVYLFLFERTGDSRSNPVRNHEQIREIYESFKGLTPGSSNLSASEQMNNQAILNNILSIYLKEHQEAKQPADSQKITGKHHVQSMINFMNENSANPIKVSDVLHFIGLERSYASRLFREYQEQSIGGYLKGLKMKRAAKLLTEGATIKEAAYSSGYRDYDYFLKVFKREHGKTPGEFTIDSGQ